MIPLRFSILLICILLISSCATILNSNTAPIQVLLSEPSTVLLDRDTVAKDQTAVLYRVERRKPQVLLHASNENQAKEFYLNHKPSILVLGNMFTPISLLGIAVDGITRRGMTYPHTVYIDFDDSQNAYLTYTPWDDARKNIIKFTPLKTLGVINPAIEFAYERILTNRISTQTKFGYLLPRGVYEMGEDLLPNRKGYLVSIEPKVYLKNKAPYGLYLGIEGSFLRSDYSRLELFDLPIEEEKDNYEERASYQDSIGIHKRNSAINFKIGYSHTYKCWVLDTYIGLGALHKRVWHTSRLHPEHKLAAPRHPNVWHISQVEKRGWTVGVPMNIAVGYRF